MDFSDLGRRGLHQLEARVSVPTASFTSCRTALYLEPLKDPQPTTNHPSSHTHSIGFIYFSVQSGLDPDSSPDFRRGHGPGFYHSAPE